MLCYSRKMFHNFCPGKYIYIYIYILVCVCVCVFVCVCVCVRTCVCAGGSKISNNFQNVFYCLVYPILKKRRDKFNFLLLALLFKQFFIKSQLNISEQETKQQTISDLLNAETKRKFLRLQQLKMI